MTLRCGLGHLLRGLLTSIHINLEEADVKLKLKAPSPALVISCIALLVALGPTVRAASSGIVTTSDIQNGAVTTPKLADEAVTAAKIAPGGVTAGKIAANAVGTMNILNNSVTLAKIRGADAKVKFTLSAGAIPSGLCRRQLLTVAGARAGEVTLIALYGQEMLQDGIFIEGTRVVSDGKAEAMVCNMSGTPQKAISQWIRVVTFG